jgi:hypothetical protein
MICPCCGALVPDNSLACLNCVQKRNSAALSDSQGWFLGKYREGVLALVTKGESGTRHIKMFGDGVWLAFCQTELSRSGKRGPSIYFGDNAALMQCCRKCREVLEQFLESTSPTKEQNA